MISLVEELLNTKEKDIYIREFLNMYPSLRNRDAYFYYKKCGIISILFHEFLKLRNLDSIIIAGKELNTSYTNWMHVVIPEVKTNIRNGKRFGHAVVLFNNNIYDLSSLQFTNDVYSIYSLKEFEKRWKKIDYNMFKKYNKTDYENELTQIL